MFSTTSGRLLISTFLLVATISSPADESDSLSVAANVPTVSVAPRDVGRNFMRLPALEYLFEIRASCSDGRVPKSVSLNVADSRKSLAADQIVDGGPTELSLQVPASQIAPLVVENFCISLTGEDADAASDARKQVSISSALSAQASLLCESEDDKAMTYVSRPLDVSLVCERVTEEEDAPSQYRAEEY